METFSASYDSTTKFISAVGCAVLLVVAVATRDLGVAGLGAVLVALCYAYSPRGYAVQARMLVVRRLIGNVEIPFDAIREIRAAHADDFTGCIRLFGNGGFFGYTGLFRTAQLGKSIWYVTNRDHGVVVIAGSKTLVLSPDDVEGFLAAVPR